MLTVWIKDHERDIKVFLAGVVFGWFLVALGALLK
jgi:hypothetical protein